MHQWLAALSTAIANAHQDVAQQAQILAEAQRAQARKEAELRDVTLMAPVALIK
jgi:hypothetical protein